MRAQAREYFYDVRTHKLYYNPNATSDGPTGNEAWVATKLRTLINISASMEQPAVNITIAGLTFADTRYTYLDPHGMPTGGDWALQRSGAITAEGTVGLAITENGTHAQPRAARPTRDSGSLSPPTLALWLLCLPGGRCAHSSCLWCRRVVGTEFTNIDGVGISLNGYHRNATIAQNDFSLIGDSAMAAWGYTGTCLNENCTRKLPYKVGPDARGGEQPHGTLVTRNLVREIGLWQKQSSMWFQAATATTRLVDNVHFNGPRAGVNFNDGMGGGDLMSGNLLANCVRESGDHGPFNSWDRVPVRQLVSILRPLNRPIPAAIQLGSIRRPLDSPIPGALLALLALPEVAGSGPCVLQYITTLRNGTPSIIPAWRNITRNFVISTYASQEAIDNDDGSSYYSTHDNFFVYAARGLKSDFGGHDNRHARNVYAFVNGCWENGNSDRFVNNTCVANSKTGGFSSDCKKGPLMVVSGNTIYNEDGKLPGVKFCDTSNELAGKWPSAQQIVKMGRDVLGFP